jgi:hypothetical protein
VGVDFAVLAGLSRGLSGGDILNICLNSIQAGSVHADPAKWRVTQGMLGINTAQVYLAKHRVGALVKKEVKALESTLL